MYYKFLTIQVIIIGAKEKKPVKNPTQSHRIAVSRFGIALMAACVISLLAIACGSSDDDGATLAAINEAKSAAERAADAA